MSTDSPERDAHVGLDLGTSGLKGVVLDRAGNVVARARDDYPTRRPEPGAAEQDPADWLASLDVVVTTLLDQVPPQRWAGLALTGMIPTLTVVDRSGRPVGPALTWEDARAEEQAAALRERLGADDLYRHTGQWVDGRYLLPMAVRMMQLGLLPPHASHLLGAKDFVVSWLTGAVVTDPSTATGVGAFDLATGGWRHEVVAGADEVAGRPLPALPQVTSATATHPLRRALAESWGLPDGLPVATGAADSVCGLHGLGLTEPGEVAYLAGSSTVILGLSTDPTVDHLRRYLVTPLALNGYGLEMDLLATGSAFSWLADLVGLHGVAELARAVRTVDPADPTLPSFAPYLAPGEQGALWDPTLTGTLTGLSLAHGPAEVARALVSGVVVESGRCLEVLSETPSGVHRIHVAGNSAPDPLPQDLADATGREVVVHGDGGWHSAIGAARISATAQRQPVLDAVLDPRDGWAPSTQHRFPNLRRREVWQRLRRTQDQRRQP